MNRNGFQCKATNQYAFSQHSKKSESVQLTRSDFLLFAKRFAAQPPQYPIKVNFFAVAKASAALPSLPKTTTPVTLSKASGAISVTLAGI